MSGSAASEVVEVMALAIHGEIVSGFDGAPGLDESRLIAAETIAALSAAGYAIIKTDEVKK